MIGVFDSGLGGLTVLGAIHKVLAECDTVYVADQAYAPYGALSEQAVINRCRQICRWLVSQGATIVVVACNTATALAIETLRQEFVIPLVGIEPGIKPAALKSKTGHVGVLATENTVVSHRYEQLIQTYLSKATCHSVGCVGLAAAVETNADEAERLVKRYIDTLSDRNIDHLVLGCTHYPLLMKTIAQYVGQGVEIIETGSAVASETARIYSSLSTSQTNIASAECVLRLYTTGRTEQMNRMVQSYDGLQWLKNTPVYHQFI